MKQENIQIGIVSEGDNVSKMIRNMSADEFDDVLFDCGIERIKPSSQSDYVKALCRKD